MQWISPYTSLKHGEDVGQGFPYADLTYPNLIQASGSYLPTVVARRRVFERLRAHFLDLDFFCDPTHCNKCNIIISTDVFSFLTDLDGTTSVRLS
jgi:hypothetical protein